VTAMCLRARSPMRKKRPLRARAILTEITRVLSRVKVSRDAQSRIAKRLQEELFASCKRLHESPPTYSWTPSTRRLTTASDTLIDDEVHDPVIE
jgi:hypothetical protein